MRPVCKRCGVKPAALDGNGEQLDWCIDCIWEWIQRKLPRVGGMTHTKARITTLLGMQGALDGEVEKKLRRER